MRSHEISLLALGLFVALVVAVELGTLFGRRARARKRIPVEPKQIEPIQAAMLALLGLLLGFSFSMAVERYDRRKHLVVEEANAIGTTFLRSQFVAEPRGAQLRELLRDYVDQRIEFYAAGIDATRMLQASDEATATRNAVWALTVDVGRGRSDDVFALYVDSLNKSIDLAEEVRASLENHVPAPVIGVLVLVALLAMALSGYAAGRGVGRTWLATLALPLACTMVIAEIVDLDHPRRGLTRVGHTSLRRLREQIREPAPARP